MAWHHHALMSVSNYLSSIIENIYHKYHKIDTKEECMMGQSNPNDNKFEQQKSPSQIAGLENQVEDNLTDGTADDIAENMAEQKADK